MAMAKAPLPAFGPIRWPLLVVLAAGMLFGIPPGRAADNDTNLTGDEQTLRAAGVGVDGTGLLEFFRKRTLSQADQDRLAGLVSQLGDPRYKNRLKASTELIVAGKPAIPFLEAAVRDADPEVVFRARYCLSQIERGNDDHLAAAAARLVAGRKPAGAAAVLLAFIPFAGSEEVTAEVQSALNVTAWNEGKPDATLVKALNDPHRRKRGAAAESLIRASPTSRRPAYRKILQDLDLNVRLQAALAFFEARDKEAVPVLIALVAQLPAEQSWQAEEALYRMAGEDPPRIAQAKEPTAARRSEAWSTWWAERRERIDLARIEAGQKQLGYTLVVLNGSRVNGDQVVELDRDGRVRWQITRLATPRDAQVLPGNRVLIAEEYGGRVTERAFEGKILWEKRVQAPIACQRLANGHTFIGTRHQLLIVDRDGKEVSRYSQAVNGQSFATALRLTDGSWGGVMSDYVTFRRLDGGGKQLASFALDFYSIIGNIEPLPNRRLLVPEYRKNRLAEYDASGRLVWELGMQQPTSVVKLPNGNLLVSSWTRRWFGEINRKGKVIHEQQLDGMPCRVRRR
jgi:HEAT repeat protein